MRRDQKLTIAVGAAVLLIFAMAIVFAWQSGWPPFEDLFSEQATPVEIAIGEETPATGEVIIRDYDWSYDRRPWSLNLQIPKELYLYYWSVARAQTPDYSVYVTNPKDDEFIQSIADSLSGVAGERGFDAAQEVGFVASFVQSLRYLEEDEEYPRYPVETLVDGGGDCEDTSILAAAVLEAMGYDVVLLNFAATTPDGAGHMAVGVALPPIPGGYSYYFEGKAYYYLETTTLSEVGDAPAEYRTVEPVILEVVPKPILRLSKFEWTIVSRWLREDKLVLEVEVTNWGTADADGLHVRAFFEEHEDRAATSDTFDLEYGYKVFPVSVGAIVMPSGEGTLCVELFDDDIKVDEWSEVM